MAVEDIELNVGGTSFKGVYIAVLVSFASTIGGGIWAASEFFSRLEAQEESVVDSESRAEVLDARFQDLKEKTEEDLKALEVLVSNMRQALEDNNVAGLQGKLAELGTNLASIMEAQKELLDMRDRVASVEMSNAETVLTVQNKVESLKSTDERLNRLQREIDDLWDAMDALANPLQ